jgi:hypothetical protein
MPAVYIATSAAQQEWGSDVGISQHLYKVGVAEGGGEAAANEAVEGLNAAKHAGQSDWQLVGTMDLPIDSEEALIAKLAERQTLINPNYYPKLKGARGIFKVNVKNVEANILMKNAMEGKAPKIPKLKPKDIAAYLLNAAA